MSVPQTELDRDLRLERLWAACMARRVDYWLPWMSDGGDRHGVVLIAHDDMGPHLEALEFQPCADHEQAVEMATVLNEQRLGRGGRP